MRIALFTDTFAPEVNGVAKTLRRWVDYLQSQGISCKIFAPEPAGSNHRINDVSPVERFASLPFVLYPECRLALPNTMQIRNQLQQFQPDLIHVATPFNLGLCGIHYARKYDIPLVASYHTNFDQYLSFYNLQWMEKILWRYMEWFHRDCKAIFVPSSSTMQALTDRGWDAERLSIWSRGVDSKLFHPLVNRQEHLLKYELSDQRFIVFYAGRLAPEKNVAVAIEAFEIFQQQVCPDAIFVLAGDGPSTKELQELCYKKGLNTKFIGFTPPEELQRWYAVSDVMLFPSPTETFGNVVLEAMSCGTPVICANQGGVLDSIEDGVNGITCDPNRPDLFAEALQKLYRNPALRIEMSLRAQQHSKEQTWDRIFEQLLTTCLTHIKKPFSELNQTESLKVKYK